MSKQASCLDKIPDHSKNWPSAIIIIDSSQFWRRACVLRPGARNLVKALRHAHGLHSIFFSNNVTLLFLFISDGCCKTKKNSTAPLAGKFFFFPFFFFFFSLFCQRFFFRQAWTQRGRPKSKKEPGVQNPLLSFFFFFFFLLKHFIFVSRYQAGITSEKALTDTSKFVLVWRFDLYPKVFLKGFESRSLEWTTKE